MKKLFFFLTVFGASLSLFAQNNVITYTASEKLKEVASYSSSSPGIYKSAFGETISSHTFNNGAGTITFSGNLTSIGTSAFYYCSTLTSITLPNSVTSIGERAFNNCSMLANITLPNNLKTIGSSAFQSCFALTSVDLPNTVTTIGNLAFYNCDGLTEITIPTGVTSIGSTAFSDCDRLSKVIWSAKNCTINTNLFSQNFVKSFCFGNEVQVIPANLCSGMKNITSVTIPSNVTTINDKAFKDCENLSINIPADSKLSSIGSQAFYGCNMVRIHMSTPPTINATNAFTSSTIIIVSDADYNTYINATGWKEYKNQIKSDKTIEVTVTASTSHSSVHMAVGESELQNVVSLKVHGTINSYDIMIFRNKMIYLRYLDLSDAEVVANAYQYYTGYCTKDNELNNYAFSEVPLRVIHLPKNLVSINQCFENCLFLDSVYCQSGLKTIGDYSFYNCSSLKQIELPDGLETIGNLAFACSGLETIRIPASVKSMGQFAFSGSTKDCSNSNYFIYYRTCNSENVFCAGTNALLQVEFAPNSQLKVIPAGAFCTQQQLQHVVFPDGLTQISLGAFSSCIKLQELNFPETLKTINSDAFKSCFALKEIVFPPHLETIDMYAFYSCTGLKDIKLSSSIKNIGDQAFGCCDNVTDLYSYTMEPTKINQNTFSCWRTSKLHMPCVNYYGYFYNTQWSQFLKLDQNDCFNDDYEYFYLNDDYTIGGDNGVVTGNPDVDLNPGSGLILEDEVELGTVDYTMDGTSSASILPNEELTMEQINIHMVETKGKWHFLTFPWDVKREDVRCKSEFVIRYYNGQTRATNGSGGWTNVPVSTVMKNGQGYIFQAKTADTLNLSLTTPNLPSGDKTIPLSLYASSNPWDANWNMIGNPYLSYYDLDGITDLTYPVIRWNGTGYDTYRKGDDEVHFKPLEGFFIQNVDKSSITFNENGCETKTQMEEKLKSAAPVRKSIHESEPARLLINLTLSSADYTDKTRIVYNNTATSGYDLGLDACKMFPPSEVSVQLFTIGASDEYYSINERPVNQLPERIQLGYYAGKDTLYTLAATRLDTTILVYDNVAQKEVDLSDSTYTFYTKAGYDTERFTMIPVKKEPQVSTSVDINLTADCSDVSIFTIDGKVYADHVDLSVIVLPQGCYLVRGCNGIQKIVIR